MPILIEKARKKHIPQIARINELSFGAHRWNPRLSKKWIHANFKAAPRTQYFVAREGKQVRGFVMWLEKGGFRKESVWELEQIAVDPNYRRKGIGTRLIKESLPHIQSQLKEQGRALKSIEVTTGTGNEAQRLYKRTLGAEPEAVVRDLFRGDEAIMFARKKRITTAVRRR